MTITVTASQQSNSQVMVTWQTDLVGTTSFNVRRNIDGAGFTSVANILDASVTQFADTAAPLGASVVYRVVESPTSDQADSQAIIIKDLDAPYTFGAVDPLVTAPRYTTLADVKARLGIDNTEKDTQLTGAIVAAEIAIDQWNERSFPDTGSNPEISGVPQPIREWSLDAAIAIWKAADAPFGQGGGDAWLGSIDVQNITERILRRHPLSLGYKVNWGIG